jgi:hypothetical protein
MGAGAKQFQLLALSGDKGIDADRQVPNLLWIAGLIQKPKRFEIDVPGGIERLVNFPAGMPKGKICIDTGHMDTLGGETSFP